MAKEIKNEPKKIKEATKESRVMQILKTEYKFENWLLAILSPILVLYGVYILIGKVGSLDLTQIGNTDFEFINFFFNTTLKKILSAVFLILIGTLVIIYLLIPYIKPSIAEMKKVNWPTGKALAGNSSRVFAFLLFLMFMFYLYGAVLDPLFKLIYNR
jgi:preprotein translocase SecE subunit